MAGAVALLALAGSRLATQDTSRLTPPPGAAYASGHDGPDRTPAAALDGDPGTHWSSSGDGPWLCLDLGAARAVSFFRIAVSGGSTRKQRHDLLAFSQAGTWVTLLSGESSGTTDALEQVKHLADDGCMGRHKLVDPIGFALEHLDASGRYRAKEGTFDIDDSGTLIETCAGELKFTGADHRSAGCIARTATDELRQGKISLVDYVTSSAWPAPRASAPGCRYRTG